MRGSTVMHLFVPPSLRRFTARRSLPSASTPFMALEYDLVEGLRPKLVVDLGAGDAVSFFTYCHSMHDHDVDGTCYAIDLWDEAEQLHPLATFDAINDHGRQLYPGLCYTVRMAPYEARRHFDEGSIDLLRVDGSRPAVVPGADLEAWYRRVRPGGVIAWHGVGADSRLWSLLALRCQTVLFGEGQGLGLALKPGGKVEGELLRLLFIDNEGAELERFYRHLHQHQELKRMIPAISGTATAASR